MVKVEQPLGGVEDQDAHLRNLLKLPGFADDWKFRQLLGLEPYDLVLEDFSRRKGKATYDLVLACRNLDRAMHAVFGRDVDLVVDVADHITANAERENLGVDFLEDRVQRMLIMFYMRLSSADVMAGIPTDRSGEGQWRGT